MKKPVRLRSGLCFSKVEDAMDYFRQILNGGEVGSYLEGDDYIAVDALFRDYCAVTNWQMPGDPEQYFRDWNKAKNRTTKCFYVEYQDGKRDDFSYIEAVRVVANRERSQRK